MKKTTIILFTFALIALIGCGNSSSKWTEEEKEAFQTQCDSQVTFTTNPICFKGFAYEEIDTIMIVEKDGPTIVDTLYLYPREEGGQVNKKVCVSPKDEFTINHSYEFYLGAEIPYVLDNMEMIMMPEYTMSGEDWGCGMRNFTIDKEKFEDKGNIQITKRGL